VPGRVTPLLSLANFIPRNKISCAVKKPQTRVVNQGGKLQNTVVNQGGKLQNTVVNQGGKLHTRIVNFIQVVKNEIWVETCPREIGLSCAKNSMDPNTLIYVV
jgi:hypothetical protein